MTPPAASAAIVRHVEAEACSQTGGLDIEHKVDANLTRHGRPLETCSETATRRCCLAAGELKDCLQACKPWACARRHPLSARTASASRTWPLHHHSQRCGKVEVFDAMCPGMWLGWRLRQSTSGRSAPASETHTDELAASLRSIPTLSPLESRPFPSVRVPTLYLSTARNNRRGSSPSRWTTGRGRGCRAVAWM